MKVLEDRTISSEHEATIYVSCEVGDGITPKKARELLSSSDAVSVALREAKRLGLQSPGLSSKEIPSPEYKPGIPLPANPQTVDPENIHRYVAAFRILAAL